ncbi:MAG TPA: hypothetical protein DCM05_02175 [Elusimicrobia bacterium]|nr:hypothetical protein [Elusimicrobiota bacterium]
MLRIFTPEEEQALFELEEARAWRRSELIAKEQLDAVELSAGKTLSMAGKAVRLLFAGFTLLAMGAASGFVGSCLGHEKVSLGAFFLLSAPAYVLLAEHLIRRHRLYRFGAEEGLLMGAAIQLAVGTYLVFSSGLDPYARQGSEILFTLPFLMGTLALYVRYGYAYAGIAAVFALAQLILYQGLTPHVARLTLSGSFAGILLAMRMREVPGYERERWDMIDACLCLAVYLPLNLRLESLANPFAVPKVSSMGHFYWGTLAAVWLIPPAVLLWGVRARKRAVLIVGAILALLSLMTLKPYLGLQRNPWDPAVLGVFLMGLGWALSRKLDSAPGWTAKQLLVPREELSAGALLAAAAAAVATGGQEPSSTPEKPRFGGGESGGAGATASF